MADMDKATRHLRPHTTIFCFRHGGTHLVKPLVKRLVKLPTFDVAKSAAADKHIPLGPVVIAYRDPRNVIVAMRKWELRRGVDDPDQPKDKAIARLIADHMDFMVGRVNAWAKRGGVRTTFEALVGPDGAQEANRIGRELDCPDGAGSVALAAVLGTGHTYTGSYSDYREWFGPRSIDAWESNGGGKLLAKMGYEQ